MAFRLPDANGPKCFATETNIQQTAHRLVLPHLSPEPFSMIDLVYGEKTPHFVTGYESINHLLNTEGNGEMSLLLLQTFFFCKTLKPNTKITVVYVDAYPGDHIPYLSEMFPEIHFRLYDKRFERSQKVANTSKITVYARPFNEAEAHQIVREFRMDTSLGSLYYVSQLRNPLYNAKESSDASNAAIIDEDMWNQLHWARIMKPEWSLIRYRAKLETERIPEARGALQFLTDASDSAAKRCLYYKYPLGYMIRVPMSKKKPMDMYLLTCVSQTDSYKETRVYYHEDIISMVRHQNEYVRRVVLYPNPYTNIYEGIYGLEVVREHAKAITGFDMRKAERYVCGAGWDHRAMFFIMTLYMRWRELGGIKVGSVKGEAIRLILRIFIEMELKDTIQSQQESTEPGSS